MLQHPAGKSAVYADLEKAVIAPGKSLAKPDEIGYVFVKCEKCDATGKRADAAEA